MLVIGGALIGAMLGALSARRQGGKAAVWVAMKARCRSVPGSFWR